MFGALDISTSALVAQRTRMDLIAANVANAQTLIRADGQPGPFRRQVALFAAGQEDGRPGVRVSEIVDDPGPLDLRYLPNHPMADERGYVAFPNVDPTTEMVNMIEAVRAYEANVTAMEATKAIMQNSLRLIT
jgi:flagellar basal-body rod protein FlgC